MSGLETVIVAVWWIIGAAFAAGAAFALWRMIVGPTIVDRMVASDTMLTIIICVLGADMVFRGHTATLPLMLVLALTAFIASVAVARYVSRQQRRDAHERAADEVAEANLEAALSAGLAPGLAAGVAVGEVVPELGDARRSNASDTTPAPDGEGSR